MGTLDFLAPPTPPHALGWKHPLPGRGALDLLPHVDTAGLTIKSEVDPRPKMPPALNQLALGSCTANATNRGMRYDTILDGKDCGELSRLWTYYFERMLEGTLAQGDCGAEGHDAYRVARHGIPDESLYPYDISKFGERPPDIEPRAYTLTKDVHAVPQDIDQIKAALSNDQTITYGFTVFNSFQYAPDGSPATWSNPAAGGSGVMPEPQPGEIVLGGHENLLCGYLPQYPDYLLSLNSWFINWGVFGGYFLIPIRFVVGPNVSDLRTIVRPL